MIWGTVIFYLNNRLDCTFVIFFGEQKRNLLISHNIRGPIHQLSPFLSSLPFSLFENQIGEFEKSARRGKKVRERIEREDRQTDQLLSSSEISVEKHKIYLSFLECQFIKAAFLRYFLSLICRIFMADPWFTYAFYLWSS